MVDLHLIEGLPAYRTLIPEVRRLFEAVFEREFPSDIWDQWYFRNPYGNPLVVMGFFGGRAVAHQAFVPQRFVNADGAVLPYVLSISSMVDRQWRSWTLFNQIIGLLHEGARRCGYTLALVLPNAKSSELYRVLYGYRMLLETPLCTWAPKCKTSSSRTQALSEERIWGNVLSYPADSTYWPWRTSVNGARCLDFAESSKIVVKVSHDGVLTVLDLLTNSCPDGAERLCTLARSLGSAAVRVTAFHANALGIAEEELVSHEGYTVRLMCRPTSEETPRIRFSLLLSDAF